MVVSVNWAQEQYFIGDFDGTSFKLMDNHPAEPLYVDKGLDFYASRTFQDFDGTLDSKISNGLGCNLGLCTGSSIEVWEGLLVHSPATWN